MVERVNLNNIQDCHFLNIKAKTTSQEPLLQVVGPFLVIWKTPESEEVTKRFRKKEKIND